MLLEIIVDLRDCLPALRFPRHEDHHIVHVPDIIRDAEDTLDIVIERCQHDVGRCLRDQRADLHTEATDALRRGDVRAVERQAEGPAVAADRHIEEPCHAVIVQRPGQLPHLHIDRDAEKELGNVQLPDIPLLGLAVHDLHPVPERIDGLDLAALRDAPVAVLIHGPLIDRPQDFERRAVHDAIRKRQGVNEPELREVFVERPRVAGRVHLPLQTVDVVDDVFFKVGRIGQHFRAIAFVAPRQQITVIHVIEGRKPLENMRVLFHSATSSYPGLTGAVQVWTLPERRLTRRIFLGHKLTRGTVPLCPVLTVRP